MCTFQVIEIKNRKKKFKCFGALCYNLCVHYFSLKLLRQTKKGHVTLYNLTQSTDEFTPSKMKEDLSGINTETPKVIPTQYMPSTYFVGLTNKAKHHLYRGSIPGVSIWVLGMSCPVSLATVQLLPTPVLPAT